MIYKGFWDNDNMNGEGLLRYSDGRILWGNFTNNEINGNVFIKYLDGKM